MKQKLLYNILLLLLLQSCLSSCNRIILNNLNAFESKMPLKYITNGKKTIVFFPIHHIGEKEFYDDTKNKIDSFKRKEVDERPQRVVEYSYKGKKVYYVVMPCCDFFSEVYDENCKFLGSPDGGFTGKGDGKLPDFFAEAKGEKLIWGTPK